MDFGHIENIESLDLSLPGDSPFTKKLFSKLKTKKAKAPQVYVGCAKWGRPDWIGKLYPKGTKAKDFLKNYTQHYNCIELNAMFYGLQPDSVIKGWASLADKDFRFCPKFTQQISHFRQLKNAERETDLFLKGMNAFDGKLGHSFLQLSENFSPTRKEILIKYLTALPRDFKVCLEVRHKDWFTKDGLDVELCETLNKLNIGTVITDTAGRRDCVHQTLTNQVAFIRFVANNLHPTDFERMDEWAHKIKEWMSKGITTIYFFIHSHEEINSPELSLYAVKKINEVCKLKLKEPVILSNTGKLF